MLRKHLVSVPADGRAGDGMSTLTLHKMDMLRPLSVISTGVSRQKLQLVLSEGKKILMFPRPIEPGDLQNKWE